MRKLILTMVFATFIILPSASVVADPPPWAPAHGHHSKRRHSKKVYGSRRHHAAPRAITRRDHIWRGRDGRYYCRRDDGTTGLVIGAALGALAGHEIAGWGDKTLGTILGAIGGGLLGRAIDRGDLKCR